MQTPERLARVSALLLAVLTAAALPGNARADVDVTGSWSVFFSNGPTGTWNMTQNGTSLTVTVPGGPSFYGFIDPQGGTFQLYTDPTPCPGAFAATVSPDGNAFSGDVYNMVPSCPGGIQTCTCVLGALVGNGRGCRIGTGADCCGDHVVGSTEQCDNGPEPATGCCDATCHARASGSTCTSDANICTSDVCDAGGTCTHPAVSAGTVCYDDQNACTTDVCDGAGTCGHTPIAAGGSCTDDGLVCTTDACDASGTCVHTPVAAGTSCTDDGQVCTADTCDANGACTHPVVDQDDDGVCDLFDACVGGVPLTTARVKVGRFSTGPGDDRLTVKGDLALPQPLDPPLDPVADGLRLVLRDSPGGAFLDVTVPPGPYSSATHTGWKVHGTGFDFVAQPLLAGAIKAVHVKRPARLPGVIRVTITGKGGSYVTEMITAPVQVAVVLHPPGDQCGEATFPTCSTRSGVVDCRQ